MIYNLLRCPACASNSKDGQLQKYHNQYKCINCGKTYPIIKGVPIFIRKETDFLKYLDKIKIEKYERD